MSSVDFQQMPEGVRQFILRHVNSMETVRILLLLRENQQRSWTLEQLVAELRSSDHAVETRLSELYDRRVLKRTPRSDLHTYTPYDDEVRRQVDELARYNQVYPYRVIELVYSRPDKAVQEFANAFKFKKGDRQ